MEIIYVVWFRNLLIDEGDEGDQWCACIQINASSLAKAHEWGDQLARARAERDDEPFLWSEVKYKNDPFYKDVSKWDGTPVISYGEQASDTFVGW